MHVVIAHTENGQLKRFRKYPVRFVDGKLSYIPPTVLRDLNVPVRERVLLEGVDNDAFALFAALSRSDPLKRVIFVVSHRNGGVRLGSLACAILGLQKPEPLAECPPSSPAERSPSPLADPRSSASIWLEMQPGTDACAEPTSPTRAPAT